MQAAAASAWDEGASFREALEADPLVREALGDDGLEALFDPQRFLRNLGGVFDALEKLPVSEGSAVVTTAGGLRAQGKVRDVYDAGTGRPAAGRHRSPQRLRRRAARTRPGQGPGADRRARSFWFERTSDLVPNHVRIDRSVGVPSAVHERPELAGRSIVVERASVIPVECVARGFLSGSGWAQYRDGGSVCGVALPAGLRESDRLPEPIFTPTTKAETGHDLPLTFEQMSDLGGARARRTPAGAHRRHLRPHRASVALERGIIVADTKVEFGFAGGELLLIDEVGTPDSSRFWPLDGYEPGRAQPSFDKQFVRDWLDASRLGPRAAAAEPARRRDREDARAKYREAYERVTGEPWPAYLARMGQGTRERRRPGAGRGAGMRCTFEVLVTLKAGLADPAGKAVEASLPAMGWTNVSGVHVGKSHPARCRGPERRRGSRTGRRDREAVAVQPRDRGLPHPGDPGKHRTGMTIEAPRVGVITFPGSLDDRDALRAVDLMGGEGVPLWHADHDLHEVDAVVLPGGFSYGDYLRCGAIAGHAPILDEVKAFAGRGGPVLGICNGFQILCESGLLPGALIRNRSLRFVCRDVYLRVETSATPVTAEVTPGEVVEIPVKHGEGQFVAAAERPRPIEDDGLVVFRYCGADGVVGDAHNPNGSADHIAGMRTTPATSWD